MNNREYLQKFLDENNALFIDMKHGNVLKGRQKKI